MFENKSKKLETEVETLRRDLESAKLDSIREIANTARLQVELHDPYIKDHCTRVAKWAKLIASRLPTFNRERLNKLEITAIVHDYGKLDVPYEVLNKPGRLLPDEYEKVKIHVETGAKRVEIISPFIQIEGVLCHHIHFDGSGYPQARISGYEIPTEARVIAVADVFDALTSDRAYRKAMAPEDAFAILRQVAGAQLDPKLVDIFETYYRQEAEARGRSMGTSTMFFQATIGEEIKRALHFLEKNVGAFDRNNPLAKVVDKEDFVKKTVDYLVDLDVDRRTADKIARYAYKMPLQETFDRREIDLSDFDLDAIAKNLKESPAQHSEVVLPLKEFKKTYNNLDVVVFQQKIWSFLADGRKIILMRA